MTRYMLLSICAGVMLLMAGCGYDGTMKFNEVVKKKEETLAKYTKIAEDNNRSLLTSVGGRIKSKEDVFLEVYRSTFEFVPRLKDGKFREPDSSKNVQVEGGAYRVQYEVFIGCLAGEKKNLVVINLLRNIEYTGPYVSGPSAALLLVETNLTDFDESMVKN